MGWEKRRNGLYYYRKVRDGRRVVSKYVLLAIAEPAAVLDAHDRRVKAAERRKEGQLRAEVEASDAALAQLTYLVSALTTAELIVKGYHQHKRQWRRRRD